MENCDMMSSSAVAGSYAACMAETEADQFPVGLSVLVVDDDKTLLRILEQMLRRLSYNVTICSQATAALSLLRERKGCFDVILSDVHMPDMDGFKLLELVGLEMDLPVIMMSADHRTNIVMKGIKHGACDYLIKPIREEELKNLWQHVARKKFNGSKENENSFSVEVNDRPKRGSDESEYNSSLNDGNEGTMKSKKKRSISKEDEDDGEFECDDPSTSKKPRVVWSVELHQQFVVAVNQLGVDKAVPKRILELMNVPGLTRENVASHLQKFRLYLKRLSGVAQQQGGMSNSFCGSMDTNVKMVSTLGRLDIRALAASGHIPPQTLAALQAELLGRPTGNQVFPTMDQPALLQTSAHGPKGIPVEHGVSFGQPLVKCQPSMSKPFPQLFVSYEDASSGFGAWSSNTLAKVGPSGNIEELNIQNNDILDLMQQQEPIHSESSRSNNVQPSCLVAPSRPAASFQIGNSSSFNRQNSSFTRSSVIDYSFISSQPNISSPNTRQASNIDIEGVGVPSGYPDAGSIPMSLPSWPGPVNTGINHQIPSSALSTGAGQLPQSVPSVTKGQYTRQASNIDIEGVGVLSGYPDAGSIPMSLPSWPGPVNTGINHQIPSSALSTGAGQLLQSVPSVTKGQYTRQASNIDIEGVGVLSGYPDAGSIPMSLPSWPGPVNTGINHQIPSSAISTGAGQLPQSVPSVTKGQCSYGGKIGDVLDGQPHRNIEFFGKGTCIPSRFAVDELEPPESNLNRGRMVGVYNIKHEPNQDFTSDANGGGLHPLNYFTQNDLMSVSQNR